jgi:pSer/pThr/pTyr-binding forkhead associated (FHA) protein
VPDPDRQVSSTHALIEVHDGAWRITDLESTNGTRLGDGPHAHVASPGISYIAPQRFFVGTQAVEFVTV